MLRLNIQRIHIAGKQEYLSSWLPSIGQFISHFVGTMRNLLLVVALIAASAWCPTFAGRECGGRHGYLRKSYIDEPLQWFAHKLFSKFQEQNQNTNTNTNVIMSPVSIHSALSLVLPGADDHSQTKHELVRTLAFNRTVAPGCYSEVDALSTYRKFLDELNNIHRKTGIKATRGMLRAQRGGCRGGRSQSYSVGHDTELSVWSMAIANERYRIKPRYLADLDNYFNSSLRQVSKRKPETIDRLVNEINTWGRGAGFDNPLISPSELTDPDLRMMLISAIKLEAHWFDRFREGPCDSGMIRANGSGLIRASTTCLHHIEQWGTRYLTVAGPEGSYRLLKIPLKGDISLTIIEPQVGGSVSEFEKSEKSLLEDYRFWRSTLHTLDKTHYKTRQVWFPKFRVESSLQLNGALKSMGFRRAFLDAQLSKISNDRVQVGSVVHQAMVETNDWGIKAAGFTKISIIRYNAPPKHEKVMIKDPFLFLLRYKDVPLFIGHVEKV